MSQIKQLETWHGLAWISVELNIIHIFYMYISFRVKVQLHWNLPHIQVMQTEQDKGKSPLDLDRSGAVLNESLLLVMVSFCDWSLLQWRSNGWNSSFLGFSFLIGGQRQQHTYHSGISSTTVITNIKAIEQCWMRADEGVAPKQSIIQTGLWLIGARRQRVRRSQCSFKRDW